MSERVQSAQQALARLADQAYHTAGDDAGHERALADAEIVQDAITEVREAERTAEHWEGLWQVAIERAEAAERKVAAADELQKQWGRAARYGEARGSAYSLTYRDAADDLRATLREPTP